MSRRMGYLSDDIEDRMTENRRRSSRTGRFMNRRMDDDGRDWESRDRRRGYESRMDDERMGDRDYDYRRRGRGYRSEMRDDDGRHGSDRDGYD